MTSRTTAPPTPQVSNHRPAGPAQPAGPPPSPRRIDLDERFELLAIALLAAVLRGWALRDQILSDDEWHGLRSAVGESWRELYLSFSAAATPGLHLLFKALHETIGLTELRMRLPMFLAGVAATVAFPVVLAPFVTRPVRRVFALLLAISPLLVYFSRYARPYSLSLFCAFVGTVALLRWYRGEGRRWAVAYAALCVAGIWMHPAFAPTLLAPLPLALVAIWRRRRDAEPATPSLTAWLRLALATGFAVLVTVGPPFAFDSQALAQRLGQPTPNLATLRNAAELALGSPHPLALLVLACLASWGWLALWRQQPGHAVAFAGVTAAAILPCLLSSANSISVPIVFLRYSLWLLPAALLLVAIGASHLLDLMRLRWSEGCAVAGLLAGVLALFVSGPLPATLRQPNAWTNHALFTYAWREDSVYSYAPNLRPLRLPTFYGQLAVTAPGRLTLVEAPWFYEWHNNPLPFYQRLHGQRVVAGMLGRLCRQPGALLSPPEGAEHLEFRNAVNLAVPDSLRYHQLDYLVFHLDIANELPRDAFSVAHAPNNNIPASITARCLPRLMAVFGTPVQQDQDLVVWDLRPFAAPAAP